MKTPMKNELVEAKISPDSPLTLMKREEVSLFFCLRLSMICDRAHKEGPQSQISSKSDNANPFYYTYVSSGKNGCFAVVDFVERKKNCALQSKLPSPLKTRPDTRLPQSRAGGWAGAIFEVIDHLGRSSEAKDRKTPKKVKCDRRTDRREDRQSGV